MKDALKLRSKKIPYLSPQEKDLLSIYKEEHNDLYQNIVKEKPEDYLQHLTNLVLLVIKTRQLDYQKETVEKILKYFNDTIYQDELLKAKSAFTQSKDKVTQLFSETASPLLHYLDSSFIKHCPEAKLALHACGNRPLVFNDKQASSSFIICLHCNMIYKPTLIKLQCDNCNNEFYSKITSLKDSIKQYHEATWLKYHCNAVINDKMKCLQCKEILFYDKGNNVIKCFNCNFSTQPENIDWKCMICSSLFKSGAKDYNPLEFKMMKISVKDALVNKKPATPREFPCCKFTDKEIQHLVFTHKDSCPGKMYQGRMNKRDIVVCSKCQLINNYECFLWKCPKCLKGFKLKKMTDSNEPQILRQNSMKYGAAKPNSASGHSDSFFISKSSKKVTKPHVHKRSSLFSHCENKQIDSKCIIEIIPKGDIDKEVSHSPSLINHHQNSFYLSLHRNLQSQIPLIHLTHCKLDSKSNNKPLSASKTNEKLLSFGSKSTYHTEKNSTVNNTPSANSPTLQIDFDADDYEILSQIGQGTFGQIYLVESPKTKERFAMKKLVASSKQEIQKRTKEYEMLMSLSKKQDIAIVSILAMQTKQLDPTTFVMYVLMELASFDWDNEIIERSADKNYYTEEELIEHLASLTKTLAELQKLNISHRDLKPANILFFKATNQLKISDFDEAKTHNDGIKQTIRGTELFMSPMLISAYRNRTTSSLEHNLYKSDLFSLGLCFIYAASLTYQPIYEIRDLSDSNAVKQVVNKYLKNNYEKCFISLLLTMIELNEKTRFDFIQFEEHLATYQLKNPPKH